MGFSFAKISENFCPLLVFKNGQKPTFFWKSPLLYQKLTQKLVKNAQKSGQKPTFCQLLKTKMATKNSVISLKNRQKPTFPLFSLITTRRKKSIF